MFEVKVPYRVLNFKKTSVWFTWLPPSDHIAVMLLQFFLPISIIQYRPEDPTRWININLRAIFYNTILHQNGVRLRCWQVFRNFRRGKNRGYAFQEWHWVVLRSALKLRKRLTAKRGLKLQSRNLQVSPLFSLSRLRARGSCEVWYHDGLAPAREKIPVHWRSVKRGLA